MRYLALDVGNKRVGMAVGSSEARIATPLAVIERTNAAQDAARILEFVREYEVGHIVVGLPRNANGTVSQQETLTRKYVDGIKSALAVPLTFYDERFSTSAALERQRARGLNEKRGRATLDASAAAVILQDFLDQLNVEG